MRINGELEKAFLSILSIFMSRYLVTTRSSIQAMSVSEYSNYYQSLCPWLCQPLLVNFDTKRHWSDESITLFFNHNPWSSSQLSRAILAKKFRRKSRVFQLTSASSCSYLWASHRHDRKISSTPVPVPHVILYHWVALRGIFCNNVPIRITQNANVASEQLEVQVLFTQFFSER